MGKMWCQHETTHWKGLQRTANIVHTLFWLFRHGLEDQPPIKKTIEDPSLNVFEQCSKTATRSVPQIYPKRSGSPSSAGRARNPATPQTTAVERVRLVEKMARGEKNPAATLRARSDGRYRRPKSWHKERDNKVWPTLQLVYQSDVGNRNWLETKIRSSQIQGLRMQTGHERRRNPPPPQPRLRLPERSL